MDFGQIARLRWPLFLATAKTASVSGLVRTDTAVVKHLLTGWRKLQIPRSRSLDQAQSNQSLDLVFLLFAERGRCRRSCYFDQCRNLIVVWHRIQTLAYKALASARSVGDRQTAGKVPFSGPF
jgi:hypothetical protein